MAKQQGYIEDVEEFLKKEGVYIRLNDISGDFDVEGDLSMMGETPEYQMFVLETRLYEKFIRKTNLSMSSTAFKNALICIADENHYNPVKEMLEFHKWDGTLRVGQMILDVFGLRDKFYWTLFFKWMAQTIAMALNDPEDPYSADGILTLQGPQGIGKTLFFRRIAVFPDLFEEGLNLNLANTDSKVNATRAWISELGEVDATINRNQEEFKAFITKPKDKIRPVGKKHAPQRPRRTSFCATVNPDRFLKDPTGNRRFWIIPIKTIDLDALMQYNHGAIMQIWAEVYERYYKTDPLYFQLTPDEQKELEKRNKKFNKNRTAEDVLMGLFDWKSTDRERYGCREVRSHFESLKDFNEGQISNALKSMAENPDLGVDVKNHSGTKKYLLPRID